MLLALYRECGGDRDVQVPVASLCNRLDSEVIKPFWLRDLKDEWASLNLASFPEDGSGNRNTVSITLHGIRQAEALPADLPTPLKPQEESPKYAYLETPTGSVDQIVPTEIVPRTVSPSAGTTPTSTSTQFRDFAEAQIVPASDRVVRFDHNNPDYAKIAEGISEVREAVRATNDGEAKPEERERILAALDAAQNFWRATQVKVIHLKVGVLLALEDALKLLTSTAKAVAAALVVDTFKAFVKNHTGVDLDNL